MVEVGGKLSGNRAHGRWTVDGILFLQHPHSFVFFLHPTVDFDEQVATVFYRNMPLSQPAGRWSTMPLPFALPRAPLDVSHLVTYHRMTSGGYSG